MMEIGTIVELAPGMEGWYEGAQPGCRGIVSDTRVDEDGFDVIYVTWDQRFSIYKAPQTDGWCFPGHFIDIGNMTPEQFTQRILREADSEVCPDCGESHDAEELHTHYVATLHAASEAASEGEAFALVWVSRETQGDEQVVGPSMAWVALTLEGQALLKAHLSRVGSVCAQEFANEHVSNVMKKRE
jgi:hypothetical protein